MKSTSRAVKASRARTGVKPTSFAFTEEERGEIEAFAAERAVSRKAAVLLAIRAYGAREPTPAQALDVLARALKGRGETCA